MHYPPNPAYPPYPQLPQRPQNVRVDVYIHDVGSSSLNCRLERIEALLRNILQKENSQMAFQQEAIDAIAQNGTLIGSVKELVSQVLAGLGDQVTPQAKAQILAALGGNRSQLAEVEAALLQNTNPPTDPPTGGQFALNVSIVGDGTVDRSPDQVAYDSGVSVSLNAVEGSGYSFSGWSGDENSADRVLNVTMNSDKNITATFVAL